MRRKHQLACRLALPTQALGAEPLIFEHKDIRSYIIALQTQYDQLRLQANPEKIRRARKAVRRTVSEQTLSRAAAGLVPDLRRLNCQRKIPHSSFESALLHLQGLPKVRIDSGLGIHSCPVCNGFHVGHTKSKKNVASLAPEKISGQESRSENP